MKLTAEIKREMLETLAAIAALVATKMEMAVEFRPSKIGRQQVITIDFWDHTNRRVEVKHLSISSSFTAEQREFRKKAIVDYILTGNLLPEETDF